MKPTKAGLWMDHNHAFLIEFTREPMKVRLIESQLDQGLKKPNLRFGEIRQHATEQRVRAAYYKELLEAIHGYEEVLLFGPGSARAELFNMLRKDHAFQDIIVRTRKTDKLTGAQMQTFVRKYFSVQGADSSRLR